MDQHRFSAEQLKLSLAKMWAASQTANAPPAVPSAQNVDHLRAMKALAGATTAIAGATTANEQAPREGKIVLPPPPKINIGETLQSKPTNSSSGTLPMIDISKHASLSKSQGNIGQINIGSHRNVGIHQSTQSVMHNQMHNQHDHQQQDFSTMAPQQGRTSWIRPRGWTEAEDQALINAVNRNGMHSWCEIAKEVTGRTSKQCRERWHNQLRPEIYRGAWSEEEDRLIIDLVKKHGRKWAFISRQLPGRTDNAVKKRFDGHIQRRLGRLLAEAVPLNRTLSEMIDLSENFGSGNGRSSGQKRVHDGGSSGESMAGLPPSKRPSVGAATAGTANQPAGGITIPSTGGVHLRGGIDNSVRLGELRKVDVGNREGSGKDSGGADRASKSTPNSFAMLLALAESATKNKSLPSSSLFDKAPASTLSLPASLPSAAVALATKQGSSSSSLLTKPPTSTQSSSLSLPSSTASTKTTSLPSITDRRPETNMGMLTKSTQSRSTAAPQGQSLPSIHQSLSAKPTASVLPPAPSLQTVPGLTSSTSSAARPSIRIGAYNSPVVGNRSDNGGKSSVALPSMSVKLPAASTGLHPAPTASQRRPGLASMGGLAAGFAVPPRFGGESRGMKGVGVVDKKLSQLPSLHQFPSLSSLPSMATLPPVQSGMQQASPNLARRTLYEKGQSPILSRRKIKRWGDAMAPGKVMVNAPKDEADIDSDSEFSEQQMKGALKMLAKYEVPKTTRSSPRLARRGTKVEGNSAKKCIDTSNTASAVNLNNLLC